MTRGATIADTGAKIPLHEKVTLGEIYAVLEYEADQVRLYAEANAIVYGTPISEDNLRKEKVLRAAAKLAAMLIPVMPQVRPILAAQADRNKIEDESGRYG